MKFQICNISYFMKTKEQKEFWDKVEVKCSDTGESTVGYKDYLKTKHWRMKRIEIYRREDRKCQKCGKALDLPTANVHHKTYEHIGNELNEELMLLCKECHREIHGIRKRTYNKKSWKERTYKKTNREG